MPDATPSSQNSSVSYPTPAIPMNEIANVVELGDDTFAIPESRIVDSEQAWRIADNIYRADDVSSRDRAKLKGMLDGAPPYERTQLVRDGQAHRTNVNFGEAAADVETAKTPYLELFNSGDRLLDVSLSPAYKSPQQRANIEPVLSVGISKMMKDEPTFDYEIERLVSEHIEFGVGISFFEDNIDWRFQAAGLEDFKFQRNCKATERSVEVAVARRTKLAHELYQYVSDVESAEAAGWNKEEVLKAIARATSTTPTQARPDLETLERQLKDNGLYYTYGSAVAKSVQLYDLWVKEFDGSVTRMTVSNPMTDDFLYYQRNAFDCMDSAFTMFTYGIGNGDLHSIRGLLYKVFQHILLSNRMQCQMVDNAFMSGSLGLKPNTADDAQNLQIVQAGAITILPANAEIVQTGVQNTSSSMIQTSEFLTTLRRNNTGSYQSQQISADGTGDRTATEVQAQVAREGTLTTSQLNLFYNPLKRLYREQVRRIIRPGWLKIEPGGEQIYKLYKWLEERGIDCDCLRYIDLDSVEPVRVIGRGSPAQKALNTQNAMQYLGFMSPEGRVQAVRDALSNYVGGLGQVNRYVPPFNAQQSPGIDEKIAELENNAMNSGAPQTVEGDNTIHVPVHANDLQQMNQAVQQGGMSPQQYVAAAGPKIQHLAQHIGLMEMDVHQKAMIGQSKQVLEQASKLYNQINQQLQAKQEAAQNAQAQQQQALIQRGMQASQQPDPVTQATVAEKMAKASLMQQKAQIDAARAQSDLATQQQQRGVTDLQTAGAIRNGLTQ